MGLGSGALIRFDDDHDIEQIGEFLVPDGHLINRRLNMPFGRASGFETRRAVGCDSRVC